MRKALFPVLIALFFIFCENKAVRQARFALVPASVSGIDFNNRLEVSDSFNILDFDYLYNGAGVAAGDFNGDGLPDLFFAGNMVSSRLYINMNNMTFRDVTAEAGVTTSTWAEGVTLTDINHDGLADIYVSVSNRDPQQPHPNLLFVNQGTDEKGVPRFKEMAARFGIDDRGYNTQAAFFDYDRDGDLDLYILSNAQETFQRNLSRPKETTGKGKSNDKLYRNNGDGTFTNVTLEAGITTEGYGLGLAITDINKDGYPDIYVANDFITNDLLYINDGNGHFTNRIATCIDHQSFNAMGIDVADINNDAWSDIMVLDMFPPDNFRQKTMFAPTENYDLYMANLDRGYEPQYVRNTLQLNLGNDGFSEIGQYAGVSKTDWSWGALMADFDHDGYRDILITNGYGKDITDLDYINFYQNLGPFVDAAGRRKLLLDGLNGLPEVKIANYMFRNRGDLTFEDVSESWGFSHKAISNGCVYADLDNDGDLDVVVNNLNEPAYLYENRTIQRSGTSSGTTSPPAFLKVNVRGDSLNPFGVGAKVLLKYRQGNEVQQQYQENFGTRGFKSFVADVLHFGLGPVTNVDTVLVEWPDGNQQVFVDVAANQTLQVDYQPTGRGLRTNVASSPALLREASDDKGLVFLHRHRKYKDFNRQRLLPHKHSENGPGMAVGDVNGDQLDDLVIGGGVDSPTTIFIQAADGTFKNQAVDGIRDADDMGLLLFDADGDGDQDLYIVSGGTRFDEGSIAYQDRLYVNDGNGNLTDKTSTQLPELTFSGSVVTAADYDGDGDLDLFVGGRVRPGSFPVSPPSVLLRNDNGKFSDVTASVAPGLQSAGMVTSALWTDFDNDGLADLLLAGEWMPVTFFRQARGADGQRIFQDVTGSIGPPHSSGWWNSIIALDVDLDGALEYILGNAGLNSRWQANAEEPLLLCYKDFDQNGSIDPIMFQYLQHQPYAVAGRDALVSQVPSWKKQFLAYRVYANTSLEDFFKPEHLVDMQTLKAECLSSSIMKRDSSGRFQLHPLPAEAQFSPVYGMVGADVNGDPYQDVLLIGNFYGNETITGRSDALKGLLLTNAQGKLTSTDPGRSGFRVDGEGRALATMHGADGHALFVAAQHNDSLRVFHGPRLENKLLLSPTDFRVSITFRDGRQTVREFPHGSGYLSQLSRVLVIRDDFQKVVVTNSQGKTKTYQF